jgi:hypothetical protein
MSIKNWSKILKGKFIGFGLALSIFLIVYSVESRPVDVDLDGNFFL